MLTEMAQSSDRIRFKDKIISNIAKAIKGIQGAVFFKNQATVGDTPLVLRNSDRQCHKLCENLDHVFLHGLRQHSSGYWKVVTEYTHKNAVREIRHLHNVTTDLGRGRAWLFMALNDALLESYVRCLTEHTRFLRKHYAKDALLLDQQQMSVLLTLTSGLECVVFQLDYDLPYLDLTAYPPRVRTASEVDDEGEGEATLPATNSLPSLAGSETAASTPESVRGMTDSDSASLSSLDATSLRGNGVRVSSISVDSGFPGDGASLHSGRRRSVTPTDTISVSSHGSAGEPDRLTRLENIVSRGDDIAEVSGGLEVIRVKGSKKASGKKKKKGGSIKSGAVVTDNDVFLASPTAKSVACPASSGMQGQGDVNPAAPVDMRRAGTLEHSGQAPGQACSPSAVMNGDKSLCGKSLSLHGCPSDSGLANSDDVTDAASVGDGGLLSVEGGGFGRERGEGRDAQWLSCETKHSLADRFSQLDSAVASIRATTISLHQHQDNQLAHRPLDTQHSQQTELQTLHTHLSTSPSLGSGAERSADSLSLEAGLDYGGVVSEDSCGGTDGYRGMAGSLPNGSPGAGREADSPMSALETMATRCAQICQPFNPAADDQAKGREERHPVSEVDGADCSKAEDASLALSDLEGEEGYGRLGGEGDGGGQRDSQPLPQQQVEEEEEEDFYSAPGKVTTDVAPGNHHHGQLQDYVDYISGHHDSQAGEEGVKVEEDGSEEKELCPRDYALRLDNNSKLQIMLDVFSHSDEEFIKMFVTREGQSEGDLKVTFVLVTSHSLYLLRQRDLDRKFETELAVPLRDLNFISLSLNKQMVNIESSGPNRRKERIWLTPANHVLAQQLVDCLCAALGSVQQGPGLRPRFSIGSDEPLQTITLRKYIAGDDHCQEGDVEIADYSLVFWEDWAARGGRQQASAREGTMLLRVTDPFKGHAWKTVYVVLRDFMLCVFGDKGDSRPQQYVRLGGEQCVGCRLATDQDRPYCIEVILAKGGSWFLSVATEMEVASWRHSLCLAVSEGMQDSSSLSCLPCVSVVTGHKLLLCHEDVQTKFCRTIASAKVEEVTALTLDPEVGLDTTYCVVDFESQEEGVSSERWVLYFNSRLEMNRFVAALSRVWREVYQVALVVGEVEDLPLQKHCQDQAGLLLKALAIK